MLCGELQLLTGFSVIPPEEQLPELCDGNLLTLV